MFLAKLFSHKNYENVNIHMIIIQKLCDTNNNMRHKKHYRLYMIVVCVLCFAKSILRASW